MSMFDQVARVRAARLRMTAARHEMSTPAAALLARGHAHPLSTMGVAAGAGFVLGSLNVHPLRVPGVAPLLSGSLAEAVAYGTRLVAELGLADAAGRAADAADVAGTEATDGERS